MKRAGVDIGRSSVKVWHSEDHFKFESNLGECREFEFDERGLDDIIGEYEGRKFTAGSLAKRESEFGDALMTDSKLHDDTVILMLIALHKLFDSGNVGVVTNIPVKNHAADKGELKMLLEGYKELTINGVYKWFNIKCQVAPEGLGIYKYAKENETIRGLNIGSRTVNAITFRDGVKIGKESDTFDFGMETIKTKDYSAMARAIAAKTGSLKWKKNDQIYVCGGGVFELYEPLLKYYPQLAKTKNPIYTDAEALFLTAEEIYGY